MAGPYKIVVVQPKAVILEKDDILGTVSIDIISIAQRKDKTSSPPPMALKLDKTKTRTSTRAAANTNKHIRKGTDIGYHHSGPGRNNAD